MKAELKDGRPDGPWGSRSAISEKAQARDVAIGINQMLAFKVPAQLKGMLREASFFTDTAVLSPHNPMSDDVLATFTEDKWARGLFSVNGDNEVVSGIGWVFESVGEGHEIGYAGLVVKSYPGHLVIEGDQYDEESSIDIDLSQMTHAEAENLFHKALTWVARKAPGRHTVSSLTVNPLVKLNDTVKASFE